MHLTDHFAIISSLLVLSVHAGFNTASSSNLAVYWGLRPRSPCLIGTDCRVGQNSFGKGDGPLAQQKLSHYCANADIDIIPLGFLLGIKTPRLNFANQEAGCKPIPGSSLIYCPDLEEDIKICQSQYGKSILLSLGGDVYTEGGFSSPAEAVENADKVWAMFGPSATAAGPRPFGTAVIDGFDFDFESQTDNLTPFAQRLRHLADESSRPFMFTAAPQCPYPDTVIGPMLASSVPMDAVFIQYYNNECGVVNFVEGTDVQPKVNLQAWDTWAKIVSANPNIKVMVGVPGNLLGGAGYVSADKLKAVLDYAKRFSSFGGVMVWDISQAYSNDGFLSTIKSALGDLPSPVSDPVTSPVIEDTVPVPATEQDPTVTPNEPVQIASVSEVQPPAASDVEKLPVATQVTETIVISATAIPSAIVKNFVQEWNQCGGIGYTGLTVCEEGLVCTRGGSEWWYSCKKPGYPWRA